MATYGFEDLRLYREMAADVTKRALVEVGADESLRTLATDVLRDWAENFPGRVIPKY